MKGEIVTSQMVADYLKRRVRRGSLVPGQRVIEAEVMKDTGATRGRVREAMQRLAAEGVVTLEEFRGASVKRLSRNEVDQNYRTREALEGMAARLFAERPATAEKAKLAAVQAELNDAEQADDAERYGTLNSEWHRLVTEGADNAYLASFIERLHVPIFRLQFGMFYPKDARQASNADHRRITAAIEAGDGDAAEAHMRQHVRDGLAGIAGADDEFFAR